MRFRFELTFSQTQGADDDWTEEDENPVKGGDKDEEKLDLSNIEAEKAAALAVTDEDLDKLDEGDEDEVETIVA